MWSLVNRIVLQVIISFLNQTASNWNILRMANEYFHGFGSFEPKSL
jgi:hypothetical protein